MGYGIRTSEQFEIPFSKMSREPKLFEFPPKSKRQIIHFCSEEVKEGTLSLDGVRTRIVNVIAPNCHRSFVEEARDDDALMPTNTGFLYKLQLSSIYLSTI